MSMGVCRSKKIKGREDFIHKSRIVHNDKYSYDKVPNHFKLKQKVTITCPMHGDFRQEAFSHRSGRGCPYCNGRLTGLTDEGFQIKVDKINDYIRKYQFTHVKVIEPWSKDSKLNKFYCEIHGEFTKNMSQVIKGQICGKCLAKKNKIIRRDRGLKKLTSSLNPHIEKFDYIDAENDTITIRCKEHNNVFKTLRSSHIHSKYGGCIHCLNQYKNFGKKERIEVIEDFRKVHGEKYVYDDVIYRGSSDKVLITCRVHGDFLQTPSSHLTGSGCPKCKNSSGEKMIQQILKKMGLEFITQKRFVGCYGEGSERFLPFDIYVPEFHTCIEFDGVHHFIPIEVWGGEKSLIEVKNRDRIKNEYCKKNEINLIRIPYTMGKLDIVNLLSKKFHKNVFIDIKKKTKWIDLNIKDLVSEYETRTEFQKKNNSLYKYCLRNKLMDHVCDLMKKPKNLYNYETAKQIAETYTDYKLFQKERPGLILYIRKNNLHELTKHMLKKRRYLSDEMLFEEIKKYENKLDLRKNDPKLYNVMIRRGYIDRIKNSVISWNEEKVIDAFKNSSSKKELIEKYRGAQNWAIKKGLYNEYIEFHLGKNLS